jgi:hypothetical protein
MFCLLNDKHNGGGKEANKKAGCARNTSAFFYASKHEMEEKDMWIAALPIPVLLVGLVCLTLFLILLLILVACVRGAAERIILILDATHNLFYGGENQRCGKHQYCRRRYSQTLKKG